MNRLVPVSLECEEVVVRPGVSVYLDITPEQNGVRAKLIFIKSGEQADIEFKDLMPIGTQFYPHYPVVVGVGADDDIAFFVWTPMGSFEAMTCLGQLSSFLEMVFEEPDSESDEDPDEYIPVRQPHH